MPKPKISWVSTKEDLIYSRNGVNADLFNPGTKEESADCQVPSARGFDTSPIRPHVVKLHPRKWWQALRCALTAAILKSPVCPQKHGEVPWGQLTHRHYGEPKTFSVQWWKAGPQSQAEPGPKHAVMHCSGELLEEAFRLSSLDGLKPSVDAFLQVCFYPGQPQG